MKNNRLFYSFYAFTFTLAVLAVCFSVFFPAVGHSASAEEIDPEAVKILENACAYAREHGFTSSMYGEVEARVFGIKYVQRIYGDREVKGESYSERAESVSAFVKTALKRSYSDGKYYVSHGKFARGKAEYPPLAEVKESEYLSRYGAPPLGLLRYEIDGNILSARKTGENEYTFTLDPQKSTVNAGVGVKSALGSDKAPKYSSVKVVLTVDGIKPVKTVCRERLKVDKFGGVECSAMYEEKIAA
ncbi:MAG: hypothetical protein J1F39_01165 [Clostridiales bacterium]|nr:hypothetical protein [Clostridiales bacterium]